MASCCKNVNRPTCHWFCLGLGFLPISVGALLATTFAVSYVIAVAEGDVVPAFPYISDTGGYPPESCIFGQLLNIVAGLAFATIYVRYKYVKDKMINPTAHYSRNNIAALILGGLATLGMSLVANFQDRNVISVHFIGAFMCFGLGTIYCFVDSWISYQLIPEYCSRKTWRIRLAIGIICTVALLFTSIFAAVANSKWNEVNPTQSPDTYSWSYGQPGYSYHLVSTISEWLLALAFLSYFFTYIRDFQRIEIEAHLKQCILLQQLEQQIIADAGEALA